MRLAILDLEKATHLRAGYGDAWFDLSQLEYSKDRKRISSPDLPKMNAAVFRLDRHQLLLNQLPHRIRC